MPLPWTASSTSISRRRSRRPTSKPSSRTGSTPDASQPSKRRSLMNAIRRAGLLAALVALVAILAACTSTDPRLEDEFDFDASTQTGAPVATHSQAIIIASGADVTLPADESVDVFMVYNGAARVEGQAKAIFVVNGVVDLVGARSNGVVAVQSDIRVDPGSVISGDIRTFESAITGATASTVTGHVREFGIDIFLGWRDWIPALFLIYVAFAVSAVMAGIVLAGLAGRQVRAAGTLITKEPVMVVAAGVVGLAAILTIGILATVTVVGIPFALGLLGLVLPGLFVVGYIVSGIWVGERFFQSSPVIRERPYAA